MKYVFNLYDTKADAYLDPFFMDSPAEAIRGLIELFLQDPNHKLCKYSEDFNLFELGKYDPLSGNLILNNAPICHGNLLSFKVRSEKQKSNLSVVSSSEQVVLDATA